VEIWEGRRVQGKIQTKKKKGRVQGKEEQGFGTLNLNQSNLVIF
jgi:hypothetical protein